MKLQYLGGLRRDGSWPTVKLGDDFVQIVDGFVDVPPGDAERLVATGNFKLAAAKAVEPAKVAEVPPVPSDKEALIAEAKGLGIPANKSWSVNAIQKAIDKVKAE